MTHMSELELFESAQVEQKCLYDLHGFRLHHLQLSALVGLRALRTEPGASERKDLL